MHLLSPIIPWSQQSDQQIRSSPFPASKRHWLTFQLTPAAVWLPSWDGTAADRTPPPPPCHCCANCPLLPLYALSQMQGQNSWCSDKARPLGFDCSPEQWNLDTFSQDSVWEWLWSQRFGHLEATEDYLPFRDAHLHESFQSLWERLQDFSNVFMWWKLYFLTFTKVIYFNLNWLWLVSLSMPTTPPSHFSFRGWLGHCFDYLLGSYWGKVKGKCHIKWQLERGFGKLQ